MKSVLISAVVLFFATACAPPAPAPPTAAPALPTQPPQATAAQAAPTSVPAKPTAPAAAPTAAPTVAPTAPPAQLTKITVSYSERVGSYLPLYLAASAGIFKAHGLDPDLQLLAGATGMSALLSGQVQIAQIGGSEVLSAAAGGSDLVMSGNLGSVSSYVFMVAPDINSIEELKGKRVGISSVGGSGDTAARLSLKYYGLDPDKDVTMVAMGSLQNRTAGLLNGAIQGAPANPPDSFLLQRQGLHALFNVSDLPYKWANATIVAQRSWINTHRDVFQAWNDSIVEAIALAKARPEVGLPVMKEFLQSDDDELMKETYDFWVNTVLKEPPVLTADQFADTIDSLAVNNPKIKDVDINSLIDSSFVQNAVDRGLAAKP